MEDYIRQLFREKIIDSVSRPLPAFTSRDLVLPVLRNKATALIGMRRTGKTSLLWNQVAERVRQGVPREASLFITFEDDRLHPFQLSYLDVMLEEYFTLFPEQRNPGANTAFFLDEIQNVPDWERFVRRIMDELPVQIFLTGSSAKLLSAEIATSMRGRALSATVFPFSFKEYLRHRHVEAKTTVRSAAKRTELGHHFRNYLQEGGFPEVQLMDRPMREQILRSYVDTAVLRDVLERYNVSQTQAVLWMLRQLLANPAGAFSVTKFYQDLRSQGYPISRETLYELFAHLEDAFLFRSVQIDTDSERKRRVNPRKVYPIDSGLIPLYDRSGKENRGQLLETGVLIELLRRGADVTFVTTEKGFEVDFMARFPDRSEMLIQVTDHLDNEQVQQREFRSLEDAAAVYPNANRVVICGEQPGKMVIPEGIRVVSAWEWFLD